MKASDGILYEHRYGRFHALVSIYSRSIRAALIARAKKHILNKRKQLVIFSYDNIGHDINLNGLYEKEELETFFKWIRRYYNNFSESTAIDVGANIGNHSLYFSDIFKHVYSFEPNPRTFKVLSLNSELVNNITCFNEGLSNAPGEARLRVNPTNIGGSCISENPDAAHLEIRLNTLDAIKDQLGDVKLIKIDVEGHEYNALQGMETVIKSHFPIILFEQHAGEFTNGRSKTIQLLRDFGYTKFITIRKHPDQPEVTIHIPPGSSRKPRSIAAVRDP